VYPRGTLVAARLSYVVSAVEVRSATDTRRDPVIRATTSVITTRR
jgi:hypothetical protein